jgi:hypothetical protein
VQVPACGVAPFDPKGSVEVFAIAMPVSKPSWLVTNGNSRLVVQDVKLLSVVVVELGPVTKFGIWVDQVGAKLTTAFRAVDEAVTVFAVEI